MNRLGQHFLKNQKIISDIVENIEIENNEIIFEIGPGHGELTKEIIKVAEEKKLNTKIICIEKDVLLYKKLTETFAKNKNVEFINGDALKELQKIIIKEIKNKKIKYKIVGNIPYYITGHLFKIIDELERKPEMAIFMIQKEVAERIVSKKMNRLSASISFWANPKIIIDVQKKYFQPQPKIDSAVIKLKKITDPSKKEIKSFDLAIKTIFAQPRKTILNNIASSQFIKTKMTKEKIASSIEKIGIKPDLRPQDLSINDIKDIINIFIE